MPVVEKPVLFWIDEIKKKSLIVKAAKEERTIKEVLTVLVEGYLCPN